MRTLSQNEWYKISGAGYFSEQLGSAGEYLGSATGTLLTPFLMSMGYVVGPVLVIPLFALENHFSETGKNTFGDVGSTIDSILSLEFLKPQLEE